MQEPKEMLADLCRRYQIEILYVFGSRAAEVRAWFLGQFDALPPGPADIDIGVKPAREAPFSVREKVDLASALEELMGVTRVDLVSFRDADPFVAANIVRGERLFTQDNYLADEYDLYILRRAGDLAPLERERIALILEKDE